MHIVPIDQCRICAGRSIETVFDLGEQALSGRFPGPKDPDPAPAPLLLVRCTDCGLVQLGHDIEQSELYGQTYGYRSGINRTMTEHLAGIAADATRRVGLKAGDIVLDVASNDGTLLKSYTIDRLVRIGIDPTIKQYGSYYPDDILKTADFFTATRFRELAGIDAKARVVTSIAMFYDLPSPHDFVADVAAILAPDGVWIFEQSDLGLMLQAKSFDTICHEHLEYYSLGPIKRLVESHGLRIVDVEKNDSNGGSSRFTVSRAGAPYPTNGARIDAAFLADTTLGLDKPAIYADFRSNAIAVRSGLRRLLQDIKERGQTVHIYGASTKGNVLLQYCGIDASLVAAAAERNPVKYGCRTPGTNIPIISEAESRAAKPDYFLVLPWHFKAEFLEREAEFMANGGKLIFPLPTLEIYPRA